MKPNPDRRTEVVVASLDAERDVVHDSAAVLSADERHRASRFAFDRDRHRFIVARARLRQLLASRLDVRPEDVELMYGAQGKPALAGRFAGARMHFNVSHADSVAVYAFADREVGIDVERIRDVPDADRIAERMFSRREVERYSGLNAAQKTLGFFNCWTRKEAFVKAVGLGLSFPLDQFDVTLAPDEPARILRVRDVNGDRCGWTLRAFEAGPGYVGALVAGAQAGGDA
jgi:4'-phosphopantetheinyl transferase